jgi:hypothetical protein
MRSRPRQLRRGLRFLDAEAASRRANRLWIIPEPAAQIACSNAGMQPRQKIHFMNRLKRFASEIRVAK